MKPTYFILFAFPFFLLPLWSYFSHKRIDVPSTQKKIIVCTTMLLKDAVDHIVSSDSFTVHALMGPGIDPHTYRAKPSDITLLLSSDVIIYNGLHLEGKMGEILHDMERTKVIICATDGIPKNELLGSDYENIYDPHVWHDITLWKMVVQYLQETLIGLFEEQSELITQLHRWYQEKLSQTQKELEKLIESVPLSKRILITAHDAFRYFGKRYHFHVLGLQGLSTESDIGIKDIYTLADLITEKRIAMIFPESCIPVRTMQALQEIVEKKGWRVSIGAELFSDSLSTKIGPAASYIDMIRYNIHHITAALIKHE